MEVGEVSEEGGVEGGQAIAAQVQRVEVGEVSEEGGVEGGQAIVAQIQRT